jgi:hypothetical protein
VTNPYSTAPIKPDWNTPLLVIGVHQGDYTGYACVEVAVWNAMGPDERRAWMVDKFPEAYE